MRRIFDQCEPTLRRQFRKRERLAGMSRIGDVDDRPSARADRFTGPLAGQPRGVGGAHVGEHRGAPARTIVAAVAAKVSEGRITSSPGWRSSSVRPSCSAAVPEATAIAARAPTKSANARSNSATRGPCDSHPPRYTDATACTSSSLSRTSASGTIQSGIGLTVAGSSPEPVDHLWSRRELLGRTPDAGDRGRRLHRWSPRRSAVTGWSECPRTVSLQLPGGPRNPGLVL
jgi:hypothetical protein